MSTDINVNLTRGSSLNSRTTKIFCQETGAEHLYEGLLYLTEIHWLSRGQIWKLRAEVSLFLKEKEIPRMEHFEIEDFIRCLAYLAYIFNHTNEINLQFKDLTSPLWLLLKNLELSWLSCRYGRRGYRPISLQTFKARESTLPRWS